MKQFFFCIALCLLIAGVRAQKVPAKLPAAHTHNIKLLELSPDGAYVISADVSTALLWDARTGQVKASYKGAFVSQSSTIGFDATGTHCFIGSASGTIVFYETQTARVIKKLSSPLLIAAFFSKEGDNIVMVGKDSVTIANWRTGKTVRAFEHGLSMAAFKPFQLSASGDALYVVQGEILRRISLATGEANFFNAPNNDDYITGFSTSPSGRKLAISYVHGETLVFDSASLEVDAKLNFHHSHFFTKDEHGQEDTVWNAGYKREFNSNAHFFVADDTLVTLVDRMATMWDLKKKDSIRQVEMDIDFDKKIFPVTKNQVWLLGVDSAYLLQAPDLAVVKQVAYPERARAYTIVHEFNGRYAFQPGQPFLLAVSDKTRQPLVVNLQQQAAGVRLAAGAYSK